MKTHSLFYRTKIVLEAEDDLFPGIDSSAFDETKPKNDKRSEIAKLRAELKHERSVVDTYEDQFQKLYRFLEDNDAIVEPAYDPVDPDEVPYEDFEWYGKYRHASSITGYGNAISRSSPIFNNIEKYIRTFHNNALRKFVHQNKEAAIVKKISYLKTYR